MSKKFKPTILWSIDLRHREKDGPSDYPFYEVYKDGRTFVILYHGSCSIKRTNTLEEAQMFVRNKIKEECGWL